MNWTKIITIALMASVTVGCFDTERHIDEGLEPYVELFEDLYRVRVDFPVVYTDDPLVQGQCFLGGLFKNQPKKIVISTYTIEQVESWHMDIETHMEMIVFHELGHCMFNLDHDDREVEHNLDTNFMQARSYMHETALAHNYELPKEFYRDELENKIACVRSMNPTSDPCVDNYLPIEVVY